jgi:hypothetical protein
MFLSLKCNLFISHVLLYSLLDLSVPSQTQQASCLEVPVRLRVFPSPAVSLETFHQLAPVRRRVSQYQQAIPVG